MTNAFQDAAAKLNLCDAVVAAATGNDLLPPRPDDGVGGELGKRFSETLRRELNRGAYDPAPAYIVPHTKSSTATRPAALLGFADRVVYQALVDALGPRIDKQLLGPGIVMWPRGTPSAKKWPEFERAPLRDGVTHIVRADISGFYESIDHEHLCRVLMRATGMPQEVAALQAFLARTMRGNRGVPQGFASSDPLATIFLASIDEALVRAGHEYVRHGDDIRIGVRSYDEGRRAVLGIERAARESGLLLNQSKTRILTRETYERQAQSVDDEIRDAEEDLVSGQIAGASDDEDSFIALLAKADREDLGWALFYHRNMTLDQAVEQLRATLKPEDLDLAEFLFERAFVRRPGTENPLPDDVFHAIVVRTVVRLTAGKRTAALPRVSKLLLEFPEKAALLCRYLDSLSGTKPVQVRDECLAVLLSGNYLTEWEVAWVLQSLRRVSATLAPEEANAAVTDLVSAPHGRWLAAAEALKLLGKCGALTREIANRFWDTCPTALRSDAVEAVHSVPGNPTWREGFLATARSDPVHEIVLRHLARDAAGQTTE